MRHTYTGGKGAEHWDTTVPTNGTRKVIQKSGNAQKMGFSKIDI